MELRDDGVPHPSTGAWSRRTDRLRGGRRGGGTCHAAGNRGATWEEERSAAACDQGQVADRFHPLRANYFPVTEIGEIGGGGGRTSVGIRSPAFRVTRASPAAAPRLPRARAASPESRQPAVGERGGLPSWRRERKRRRRPRRPARRRSISRPLPGCGRRGAGRRAPITSPSGWRRRCRGSRAYPSCRPPPFPRRRRSAGPPSRAGASTACRRVDGSRTTG